MDSWKQYVLSLIICGLSCGIISQICSDTSGKMLVRMICGLILAVVLLGPLTKFDLDNLLCVPQMEISNADEFIQEGKLAAAEARAEHIKATVEAYILDKASMLGGEITAHVMLNEDMIPDFVEIHEAGKVSIHKQLESILTVDLGIPKEHQSWIWNQEERIS